VCVCVCVCALVCVCMCALVSCVCVHICIVFLLLYYRPPLSFITPEGTDKFKFLPVDRPGQVATPSPPASSTATIPPSLLFFFKLAFLFLFRCFFSFFVATGAPFPPPSLPFHNRWKLSVAIFLTVADPLHTHTNTHTQTHIHMRTQADPMQIAGA